MLASLAVHLDLAPPGAAAAALAAESGGLVGNVKCQQASKVNAGLCTAGSLPNGGKRRNQCAGRIITPFYELGKGFPGFAPFPVPAL
jgi:hypothetical protein